MGEILTFLYAFNFLCLSILPNVCLSISILDYSVYTSLCKTEKARAMGRSFRAHVPGTQQNRERQRGDRVGKWWPEPAAQALTFIASLFATNGPTYVPCLEHIFSPALWDFGFLIHFYLCHLSMTFQVSTFALLYYKLETGKIFINWLFFVSQCHKWPDLRLWELSQAILSVTSLCQSSPGSSKISLSYRLSEQPFLGHLELGSDMITFSQGSCRSCFANKFLCLGHR